MVRDDTSVYSISVLNTGATKKWWSNPSNKLLQLATQHCCVASWKALLHVLPPTSNWSSMLCTCNKLKCWPYYRALMFCCSHSVHSKSLRNSERWFKEFTYSERCFLFSDEKVGENIGCTKLLINTWHSREHGWRMRLARCLSPCTEFQVKPVGRGYSWMGDHLGIASCWFSKKLGTHVSRIVVVGLSRASSVFLRVLQFSSDRKINHSLIHLS